MVSMVFSLALAFLISSPVNLMERTIAVGQTA